MKLTMKLRAPGSADGIYTLRAPGSILGLLYWAEEFGPLENMAAFASIALGASNGTGSIMLEGDRAIPEAATHVLARVVSGDLKHSEEALFPLPFGKREGTPETVLLRAAVLSDVHLASKPGTLTRALRMTRDTDCLLVTGDLTNDGREEEFALFEDCLHQNAQERPMFCVNGNHDLMVSADHYFAFQQRCCGEAVIQGVQGTYRAMLGQLPLFALNAGKPWKNQAPISKAQLTWLDEQLEQDHSPWRILLCHTPLQRAVPMGGPYLSGQAQLEDILDRHGRVIFLSGHTHYSPAMQKGLVSWDPEKRNAYINCGSIRPTNLGKEDPLSPADWVDGNWVELTLKPRSLSIRFGSLHTGNWMARGIYDLKQEETI